MDKRLIDAEKLLEWLSGRMQGTGSDGMYYAYESVYEAVGEGLLSPDPIPLPTIKPGDRVKSTGIVVSVSEETAVIEDFVGNRYDALLEDLEVSHD